MTLTAEPTPQRNKQQPSWKSQVKPYQSPDTRKSIWQVVNSFGLLFIGWTLMYFSLSVSYWLTLLLALPTAGAMVRIFIIQHDCGHGSFLNNRKWNDRLGVACSILTLTPYYQWRKSHAVHHATSGNLEKRGMQDIYTMTTEEFDALSPWAKFRYRLYRNPVTLFLIIPSLLFVLLYRFPKPGSRRMEISSVLWTNFALLGIVVGMGFLVGIQAFILIHLPLVLLSTSVGTWLFFVQHQFEDTYWATQDEWDYTTAALQGSSYYQLPKVLQWFTGNIGFHHIHHLSPKIPNYNLEQCHTQNADLQNVATLTLSTSLKTTILSLWDAEQKRLISFREWRAIRNFRPSSV